MMELLIVGGVLFVAYTLAQGNRAKLASGLQPNTLIANTGGRSTVVTGEDNSPSPLALTQRAVATPPGAIISPYVPINTVAPVRYLGPPVSGIPVISGSTSFSTAADPLTGPNSFDAGTLPIGIRPIRVS